MKLGEDKKLKKSLSDIMAQIAELNGRIAEIEAKEENRRQEHSIKCKVGVTGVELHEYSEYMSYLHDVHTELSRKVDKLIKKSDDYKAKLLVLYNEIKALNRMKDEQKRQYLKEIQDEENRQIDEFVSYKSYSSL